MAKSEYGAMKGTAGMSRKGKGAEKTITPKGESGDGGGGPETSAAASAIYKGAVRNEGGGDSALKTR